MDKEKVIELIKPIKKYLEVICSVGIMILTWYIISSLMIRYWSLTDFIIVGLVVIVLMIIFRRLYSFYIYKKSEKEKPYDQFSWLYSNYIAYINTTPTDKRLVNKSRLLFLSVYSILTGVCYSFLLSLYPIIWDLLGNILVIGGISIDSYYQVTCLILTLVLIVIFIFLINE